MTKLMEKPHAKDFLELGEIKATKGNLNYALSGDIDTEKYNTVLVC